MKCQKCDVALEEGWLNNNTQNWTKGHPFGQKLASWFGMGMAVTTFRCPQCGEVKIFTRENLKS